MNYDSSKDTGKHIAKVNDYIGKCIIELDERGINHNSDTFMRSQRYLNW